MAGDTRDDVADQHRELAWELPYLPPPASLPLPVYDRSCTAEQEVFKAQIGETIRDATSWMSSPAPDTTHESGGDFVIQDPVCIPKCQFLGNGHGGKQWQEYELCLDHDTHSNGFTQWFFFAVRNAVPCTVAFHIINLRKKKSLHSVGLQPHVMSMNHGRSWSPLVCTDVSYIQGQKKAAGEYYYTLSFSYCFRGPEDVVFFSFFTPYTFSTLRQFVTQVERHPIHGKHIFREELCKSIAGAPVPVLWLSKNVSAVSGRSSQPGRLDARTELSSLEKAKKKPTIVVIARQHPGETVGSWMCQGLLRFLLGSTFEADQLLEQFCFRVVPMVNIDGVLYGNSRCTLAGVDPNRHWTDPNPILHPVVHSLKAYLRTLCSETSVRLFLDLHGHALKPGAFFYGCGASDIQQALLPRIASLGTRDICFPSSRFKFAKAHSKTARAVVFRHFGISASYTIEASFMGSVIPETAYDASATCFTCFRVETIGSAVGRAMAVFLGIRSPLKDETNIGKHAVCKKEDEKQGGNTDVVDLLLNPQVYPAIGVFSGEEEKCCPWLMFDEFRKMTAEAVLADMMACGSSMRELLNHEEGAGSDSNPSDDNKEEDEGSSSRRARDRVKGGATTPRGKARRSAGTRKGSGGSPLGPERDRLRATNCRQALVAKASRRTRASPLPPEQVPRARPPVPAQVAGSPSARSPSAVAEALIDSQQLCEPALRQWADLSDGGGESSAVSQGVASRSDSPLSAPKSPLKTRKDAEAIGILTKPFANSAEAKQGREAINAVISAARSNLAPHEGTDAKLSSDGEDPGEDSSGWPSSGMCLRRCLSAVSSVGRGEGDPATPASSDARPIAENPTWFTANDAGPVVPGPEVVTLDLGIQPRESVRPPQPAHCNNGVSGAASCSINSSMNISNRPTPSRTDSKRSCSPASPHFQQPHSSTKRGHDPAKSQENRRQWRGASHSLKLSGLALPKTEQSSLNIPSSWKRMGSSQPRNHGQQGASPAGSPLSVSARHGSHWPQVARESEQSKRAASSRPSSRQRSRVNDESAVIHVHGPDSGLPRVVGDQLSSRGPRRYLRTLGD
mmetsp:Transcript_74968/g.199917  ORF Transcript_74968/g.199917 Transcript_74968/m.199917 type:complete len:1075 (+) Transcript_74968:53-3277(+)